MKSRGAAIAALIAVAAAADAQSAGRCEGDSAQLRILPKAIGRPGRTTQAPFALPCDSMVVPAGQTTTIYGASMLHFGPNPPAVGKIVVKGELVIEGKPGNPAYLCGSVAASEFGFVPGSDLWDGLQVYSGAALRISHARIFNAPTALVAFGKNVVLEDCYFRGTSGIILPDTSLFLDPRGQTVDALDLRNGKPPVLSMAAKPAARRSGPAPSSASPGKRAALIAAGGIGILAASGIAWWALRPDREGNAPRTFEDGYDPLPSLPNADPASR